MKKHHPSKLISYICGGIGNQLFCYAAARRLALVNNAELVTDHISYFASDQRYQRCYQLDHFSIPCRKATAAERLEPFERSRRWLKRRLNARRPFEQRSYLCQEGIDFDPRLLNVKVNGVLHLEGYWQSEGYFKDVENIIRQDLRIQPPVDAANRMLWENITKTQAIAIHVRFFDPPNMAAHNNASGGYYARAVARMEALIADGHYFIFSDQPAAARSFVPLPDERVTLVHYNQSDAMAYADLWLMSQCRHFIIANSTFSWWGAWLSAHEDKQVIAPGFEKRSGASAWGFKGLFPPSWRVM